MGEGLEVLHKYKLWAFKTTFTVHEFKWNQHFFFEIIMYEQGFHTYTSDRTCKKFIDSQEKNKTTMLAGQLANRGLIHYNYMDAAFIVVQGTYANKCV